MIPIIKVRASIPGGHSNGDTFHTDEEYTWAMAEAAEWSRKHLHYEEVKIKGVSTAVKYAFDPESYSVHNYYEYIPLQVKMAENDIKQKFFNKHKGTY